jgi:hypothetical protein
MRFPHQMPLCDRKVRAGVPVPDRQRKRPHGRVLEQVKHSGIMKIYHFNAHNRV